MLPDWLSLSPCVRCTVFRGDPPSIRPPASLDPALRTPAPLTSPTHSAQVHCLQELLSRTPLDLAHPACPSFLSFHLSHLVVMPRSSAVLLPSYFLAQLSICLLSSRVKECTALRQDKGTLELGIVTRAITPAPLEMTRTFGDVSCGSPTVWYL